MRCWPPCAWLVATLRLATAYCWRSAESADQLVGTGKKSFLSASLQRPLLTKLSIVPSAKREMFRESGFITTEQAIKDVFGTERQ